MRLKRPALDARGGYVSGIRQRAMLFLEDYF
jgi:hypothetical protein